VFLRRNGGKKMTDLKRGDLVNQFFNTESDSKYVGIVLHEQAISGPGIGTEYNVSVQYEVLWSDGSRDWNWREYLSKVNNV
jgi:hypothetical protein